MFGGRARLSPESAWPLHDARVSEHRRDRACRQLVALDADLARSLALAPAGGRVQEAWAQGSGGGLPRRPTQPRTLPSTPPSATRCQPPLCASAMLALDTTSLSPHLPPPSLRRPTRRIFENRRVHVARGRPDDTALTTPACWTDTTTTGAAWRPPWRAGTTTTIFRATSRALEIVWVPRRAACRRV